jgi:spore coat polysaccharide biosynthesis protein SpsF (cytidylyltransferase family)
MNMADKQYREKVFWNERRNARARYKPTYLEEAYDWNLKNQRMTVKA